jgi:hypothetical protein
MFFLPVQACPRIRRRMRHSQFHAQELICMVRNYHLLSCNSDSSLKVPGHSNAAVQQASSILSAYTALSSARHVRACDGQHRHDCADVRSRCALLTPLLHRAQILEVPPSTARLSTSRMSALTARRVNTPLESPLPCSRAVCSCIANVGDEPQASLCVRALQDSACPLFGPPEVRDCFILYSVH